jgi:cell division transport system permease protein
MIYFWVKESLKSIKRAKSSFFLTLISLTLAVILIQASIIVLQASQKFQKKLKSNINVSVFIQEPFADGDIENYQARLVSESFVNSVTYISKEDAADVFIGETGEDFRAILDYNPLPASFVINLEQKAVSRDSLNQIIKKYRKLSGLKRLSLRIILYTDLYHI